VDFDFKDSLIKTIMKLKNLEKFYYNIFLNKLYSNMIFDLLKHTSLKYIDVNIDYFNNTLQDQVNNCLKDKNLTIRYCEDCKYINCINNKILVF
jgi:hypothetical protein